MIHYSTHTQLETHDVMRVFNASGITRPTHDAARIGKMLQHANLTVSAWHGTTLVGLARCLTDHSYCCYVSDLAVDKAYQHQGIGETLLTHVREAVGTDVSVVLLSAPGAMGYYPKVGFTHADNAFVIRRER